MHISLPLSMSQSLAVLSMLPVAITVLCGLNDKQTISALWPLNVWKHFPLSVLHNLHVLSNDPVAILSLKLNKLLKGLWENMGF